MKSISPTPWSFEYSPYRLQNGVELPAYEVLDANGEKIFDTNELTLTERQEANARLAAAAPLLFAALTECVRLLADFEDRDGEEALAYHGGLTVLQNCGT